MTVATIHRIPAVPERQGGVGQKFPELLRRAGLAETIKPGDLTAVKIHFGEPGNIRYVRPIFAVMVVDALKRIGARPFVTDSPVMYTSKRHDAYSYYEAAHRHGFTSEVLGGPLIISGGLGDHSVPVTVVNPQRMANIGVNQEIWDADALVSLAHVTLHLQFPLGATLKNIGMGCVDKPTKIAMHDARGRSPRHLALQEATVDGASAILKKFSGKFLGINLMLDITPDCDCFSKSELPIVPDLGVLAGADPVALDKAAFDLITAAPGYPGSKLEGTGGMVPGNDKVQPVYPRIEADPYFEITSRAGIGSLHYQLLDY